MTNTSFIKTKFEIQTAFPEGLEKAFAYVTDLMNFPEIHPLITKVVRQDEQHFLCFETIHILFVTYPFHYWVTVCKNPENQTVEMKAEVQKGVWINLVFFKINAENNAHIADKIEISGPWFIRKILASIVKKAHLQMFKNLKNTINKIQ